MRRALTFGPLAVLACALAHATAWKLNEWDVMCALRDIVHRSIALEFIKIDPYQLVDATRRDINLDAPLCSSKTVKEGLVNGTCNPLLMKKCGSYCVELTMDASVHARAARQINTDLRAICGWLPRLKLAPGRNDHHPSFFYFGRNRSVASLGCETTPIVIESAIFDRGALKIRYRGSS